MGNKLSKDLFCTLYLVRHGETEWNVLRRIQGQLNSELTSRGIAQSQEQAEKLRHVPFDAIFSSDLSRAKRTADILKLDRQLAITTSKALRERTFGEFDGALADDYNQAVRHFLSEYEKLAEKEQWRYKFAKGYESDEELVSRFITYVREIAVGYTGKTVLVVTHGGNLRTFLAHVGLAPLHKLLPGTFKNAGYIKVRSDGTDLFVDEVEGAVESLGLQKS